MMDIEAGLELREAKAEIRRHHEDFERIREVLDEWGSTGSLTLRECVFLRQLRNIVG